MHVSVLLLLVGSPATLPFKGEGKLSSSLGVSERDASKETEQPLIKTDFFSHFQLLLIATTNMDIIQINYSALLISNSLINYCPQFQCFQDYEMYMKLKTI